MMTTKKFNKAMAEATRTNKKNTVIAAGAAGLTGVITSATVYLINNHKNKKSEKEIENLKTDVKTIDKKINSVVSIIAEATTTPTTKDTDSERNKMMTINMFVMADAIDKQQDLYTKTKDATIDATTKAVTAEAVYTKMTNPKLSDFKESVIYMKQDDYNKMYPKAETTEEKTEDKADKK